MGLQRNLWMNSKGVWVQVPPLALQIRHGKHDLNTQAGQAEVCTPPHADR
jgi:hypothetical protein